MEESTNKWLYRFQWIAVGIALVVILFYASTSKGADNESVQAPKEWKPYVRSDQIDEWPTQIIYDTMIGCYEGTLRWVLLSNPQLTGVPPGIMAQRQMLEHCFCVIDKIRKTHTFPEYMNQITNSTWLGQLYMSQALACVDEYDTLPRFFTTDNSVEVVPRDDETKPKTKDNELDVKEESEDSQEQLPSEKPIESEEDSKTIFQG